MHSKYLNNLIPYQIGEHKRLSYQGLYSVVTRITYVPITTPAVTTFTASAVIITAFIVYLVISLPIYYVTSRAILAVITWTIDLFITNAASSANSSL